LIPDVALEIERLRPALDFRFTVTLPADWHEVKAILARAEKLGVAFPLPIRLLYTHVVISVFYHRYSRSFQLYTLSPSAQASRW
jgi:hypothetical protein